MGWLKYNTVLALTGPGSPGAPKPDSGPPEHFADGEQANIVDYGNSK